MLATQTCKDASKPEDGRKTISKVKLDLSHFCAADFAPTERDILVQMK